MENNLQTFINTKFGTIRSTIINGEPYFVGKDIAESLKYKDTSDALKRHIDVEDKLTRCFTDSGQARNMVVINESGLYSLIFGSKLDSAKEFKKWVTSEVLPAIRKYGMYATDSTIEKMLNNPDTMIAVLQELKNEREQKIALEKENQKLLPDAKMANDLMKYNGLYTLKEIADVIECGRTELCTLLRIGKVLSKQSGYNLPLRKYIQLGYFKVKIHNSTKVPVTLIAPKGLKFIYRLIKKFDLMDEFNSELLISAFKDSEVA